MNRLFTFAAGASGSWEITRLAPVIGETFALAQRLDLIEGEASSPGCV